MTRGADFTLRATTGWVLLATSVALGLIVYAMLTFIALFPSSSAQILVRLT